MSVETNNLPLWYIEFRCFGAGDGHVPLMYIPNQRSYVRGETEDAAKAEVYSWASPGGHVTIGVCERAPSWMETTNR